MARPVLVTGFGPFMDVADNPSARLALAVHDPPQIHGLVIPVSYARGPALAIAEARRLGAGLVLGLGVATGRATVSVERVGRLRLDPALADIDGSRRDRVLDGPDRVAEIEASLPVGLLARELGAEVSEDAGAYVCNAWLYEVAAALGDRCAVGFVHLPPAGLAADRLRRGIAALLAQAAAVG